jgi:hypothetical protein
VYPGTWRGESAADTTRDRANDDQRQQARALPRDAEHPPHSAYEETEQDYQVADEPRTGVPDHARRGPTPGPRSTVLERTPANQPLSNASRPAGQPLRRRGRCARDDDAGAQSCAVAQDLIEGAGVTNTGRGFCHPTGHERAASALSGYQARASASTQQGDAVLANACTHTAFALSLRCDVLVDVEKVAGVVGAFDLNQPRVVLAVVVSDPAVIVILHEVDVATRLRIRRHGLVVVA